MPKKIQSFSEIRITSRSRIPDQRIRIPPSGSQMGKRIRIPALRSRTRPTSRMKLGVYSLLRFSDFSIEFAQAKELTSIKTKTK